MTYAPAERAFYDADSHVMELPNFLRDYADPDLRDEIYEVTYSASIVTDEEVEAIMAQGGRHSPEHVAEQIALGDGLIAKSKEIQALGAFDGADRKTAIDMLGFKKQLVFPTHSVLQPFHPSSKTRLDLRYGAARAVNRHMAEICSHDARLMPVCVVALDDPDWALKELDHALELGAEAIWVPHRAPIGRAPGHVELEPFWARSAVRAARRRRATAGHQGVEQQRAGAHPRLDGWRRERADQGRGHHAPGTGDLHQHAAA